MSELTAAVSATETLWTVDTVPDPAFGFYTVGSEIIEVMAGFPGGDPGYAVGQTFPSKIRVIRATNGTTAATHADGVALTAANAFSGGGGAVSVDNTVDPPAEVTTLIAAGAVIVGDEATLPTPAVIYYDDADPGAVGAGAIWIRRDDVAVLQATFVRADDDLSWLTTGLAVYGDGFDQPATKYIRLDPSDETIEVFADGYTVLIGGAFGISLTAADGSFVRMLNGGIEVVSPDVTQVVVEDGVVTLKVSGTAIATFDATGVAFNAYAGIGVIPVVPLTTPDAQDVIDALVALGLITQSD